MPRDDYDLSHLETAAPALEPRGPSNLYDSYGIIDNVIAAFNAKRHVDSAYSLQFDLYDSLAENEKKIAARYGGGGMMLGGDTRADPSVFGPEELSVIASQYTDSNIPAYFMTDSARAATLKKFQDYNARLTELQKVFPEIETFDQIFAKVKAQRVEYAEAGASTYAAAGFGGTLGSFAGALTGSLDFFRDPLVFGSLFAGGAGKSIAMRVATEAGIAGIAQTTQDYLFVQPTREALGEPDVNYVNDFLMAAALGGITRGAIEGAGPGYRALENIISPGRKFARALEEDIKAFNPDIVSLADATPAVRAGKAIFDSDEALRAASPYGNSDEGIARFVRELDQVDQAFSYNNFEPEPTPREPQDIRSATADRELLKTEAPEVFAKLEKAETRLDEQTARAGEIEDFIDNRTVGDIAATLTDKETGARIKAIEKILDDPEIPDQIKRQAELQADKIINEIGADRIIKAGQDQVIKPKYQLREARGRIKEARREFNFAAREAFAELDRINSRKLADQVFERKAAVSTAEVALKKVPELPVNKTPDALTSDSAKIAVKTAEDSVKAIPEKAEAMMKTGQELLKNDTTTFTTSKGSSYSVEKDGTTTRNKAARSEHPGEQGPQPTSQRTVYADSTLIEPLGLIQTEGGYPVKLVEGIGHIALTYTEGPNAGKIIDGTVVPITDQPAVGLVPIESWEDGSRVHFGNEITKVLKPEENLFDLGNGDSVSLDFRVELEDGSSASVREILSDLGDDDAMTNAMKVCMI